MEKTTTELENYEDFLKGLALMGNALTAISNDGDDSPIKLIVSRIAQGIAVNGDDIAMLRFAVDNNDKSLTKLTKEMTTLTKETPNAAAEPVSE